MPELGALYYAPRQTKSNGSDIHSQINAKVHCVRQGGDVRPRPAQRNTLIHLGLRRRLLLLLPLLSPQNLIAMSSISLKAAESDFARIHSETYACGVPTDQRHRNPQKQVKLDPISVSNVSAIEAVRSGIGRSSVGAPQEGIRRVYA